MTGRLTALVLAGRRAGPPDALAAATGAADKALLPVAGRPMLAHVVDALAACPLVGRILVAGGEELRLADLPGRAASSGRLARIEPAETPAATVAAAFAGNGAPLLVATGDHPLLTPAMVSWFVEHAPSGADAAAAVARREVVEAAGHGTRRTWLRFADGAVSGCNLFLLRTPRAAGAVAFWRRIEAARKRPLAMALRLGPVALGVYAVGRLSLAGAVRTLGARSGTVLAAVEMPFAEAAIDVDRPADLALAERLLVAR